MSSIARISYKVAALYNVFEKSDFHSPPNKIHYNTTRTCLHQCVDKGFTEIRPSFLTGQTQPKVIKITEIFTHYFIHISIIVLPEYQRKFPSESRILMKETSAELESHCALNGQ